MHVAYIHQHFSTPQGATGTRSYEMARRLIDAGHRVTMLCGRNALAECCTADEGAKPGRETQTNVDGIQVIRVHERYGNRMGFNRRLLSFGRFAQAARRIVYGLDADLIFATSTPLTVGWPAMKGAKRLGVPFVFEVRDLWPELPIALGILRDPLLKAYARRLERRIYRAADRIIALARGIRDGIVQNGIPSGKIELIPNFADVDSFRPSPQRLVDACFGDPSAMRLAFTGAHGLANGLDAVLDACVELKRRGEGGIRFVFIGDGNQRDQLMRRTEREGLTGFVTWHPPMPKKELARVLPGLDVGMMILKNVPGFYNGTSPNKFFEYLAAGLPVLNNYPGWLAELITRHDCGVVVPPDNPTAFADAVVRLRDDPSLRERMGAAARRLAEMEFSRDDMGRRFVEVLERARADASPTGPRSTCARSMAPNA